MALTLSNDAAGSLLKAEESLTTHTFLHSPPEVEQPMTCQRCYLRLGRDKVVHTSALCGSLQEYMTQDDAVEAMNAWQVRWLYLLVLNAAAQNVTSLEEALVPAYPRPQLRTRTGRNRAGRRRLRRGGSLEATRVTCRRLNFEPSFLSAIAAAASLGASLSQLDAPSKRVHRVRVDGSVCGPHCVRLPTSPTPTTSTQPPV